MKYLEFINNEIGYLNWVSSNPDGFVINTSKGKRLDYRILHSADCDYVTTLQGNAKRGGFTERNYIKICSGGVEGLRDWTRSEGEASGKFTQECARCKPWLRDSYSEADGYLNNLLSLENVKLLYDKYFELVKFEVIELGVKPTEVRHLLGRLGEFYCALAVDGVISHVVNQHGFDVISADKRRISVKTTAQVKGFVAISAKTIDQVDDLMILQYQDGHLHEVYYGNINNAISAARYYSSNNKYELDINKAKNLHNESQF